MGINDTGYFYSSFGNILRASELLGRTEVFTDPESRQLFDRIMAEVTPDGAAVQYGAHGGYNSTPARGSSPWNWPRSILAMAAIAGWPIG